MAGVGRLVGGHPEHAAVGIGLERAVVEILAQQAEFPELIRDVLAHVGDRAIGAHDHLALFGEPGHHPAARVLAFGLEVDRLAFLQQLEGRRPELQVQDLALARQHVVLDVQPQHGLQVRLDDGIGHQVRQFGDFALARLDGVQRGAAPGQRFGMVLVVARRVRVQVPAVIIEAHRGVGEQRLHVGRASSFPDSGIPPRRRPPARRCCRCSSALPRACRRRAACARTCRRAWRCAGARYARPYWD